MRGFAEAVVSFTVLYRFDIERSRVSRARIEIEKIRDDLLNAHSFITIFEARREAAEWRQDYNEVRPHFAIERQGNSPSNLKLTNSHSYRLRRTPSQVTTSSSRSTAIRLTLH